MHRAVTSKEQAARLVEYLTDMPLPYTVTVKEGEAIRGLSHNALLHMWFDEIAKHRGDMTLSQVKGECHQRWAVSILLKNPQWAWMWEKTGAGMNTEQQRKFLAAEIISTSSAMTPKELKQYMDEIEQEFLPQGARLTMPKDRK